MAAPDLNDVPPLTDEDLVEMIASGDHDAFSNLYDRYFKRVYHFANRRLNNTADVEETVQEVFINVFSSIDSYRREAPFGAWIFGVTRRTIASRFKKKRHPTVPLDDGDSGNIFFDQVASPVAPSAIETIEFKERVRTIKRLMNNLLTPEQRVLFDMHHVQDRPIQEIAQTLNRSENAIKSNLYRARKILLAY
ncbi:MAG: RNA polymerase sigma factor [Myxococcota bacterium]